MTTGDHLKLLTWVGGGYGEVCGKNGEVESDEWINKADYGVNRSVKVYLSI